MPYLPNSGLREEAFDEKAVMVLLEVLGISGVSSASAVSPGEDSIPEASEYISELYGLQGVVNAGFRNAGAGVEFCARKELVGLAESNCLISTHVTFCSTVRK